MKKLTEELEKVPKTKLKSIIILLIATTILLTSLPMFTISVSGGASIVMANYYPDDGETYESIDHFSDQATAVNTNTTVSVRIDGGPPIPMMYQGIKNQTAPDDTGARDW